MGVELKTATGGIAPEQKAWLAFLRAADVPAMVWRPADWASGLIEQTFREGPAAPRGSTR